MSINTGFPLSHQQRRLWWLQQQLQASPYHVRGAICVEGEGDADLLKAALESVVRRHEILRTAIVLPSGRRTPLQALTHTPPVWGAHQDLSALAPDERSLRTASLYDSLRHVEFDPARGAPMYAAFVTLTRTQYVLHVVLPALYADVQTLENITAELASVYAAGGRTSAGTDEVLQYADFAAWQRELEESAEAQQGRDYWSARSVVADIQLPFTWHQRSLAHFVPSLSPVAIPPDVLLHLGIVARQYAVPESAVLLACWEVLLWRLTMQSEMTTGLCCDGRPYAEMRKAMGLYSCYLPFRCEMQAGIPVSRLFQQMATTVHETSRVQEYFSWDAVTTTHTAPPCFTAGFSFDRFGHRYGSAKTSFWLDQCDFCSEPMQVQLVCQQQENSLCLALRYDQSTFRDGIGWLAAMFATLLSQALRHPDSPIDTLELLGEEERRRVLIEWNDTAVGYPQGRCLHELFEVQAEEHPDRVAIMFADQRLTYAALNQQANRWAQVLCARGVGPESLVGVCMERSLEMGPVLLGIMKAGGAYVPLDPRYPKDRLAMILEDAAPQLVVTTLDLARTMNFDLTRSVFLEDVWRSGATGPVDFPVGRVSYEHLVYVLYTSGSTGRPKGVAISHRALVNFLWSMRVQPGLGADDVVLAVTSLSFDISGLELYLPLVVGGQMVIAGSGVVGDGEELLALIQRHEVTVLQATPATWRLLLMTAWNGSDGVRVFCGGEALPPDLAGFIRQRAKSLWNMYGPTETTIWSAVHAVEGELLSATPDSSGATFSSESRDAFGAMPIGRPIANTQLYLLDTDQNPVAIGVTGEIFIAGTGLARGYHHRPGLTAECFVPAPFGPSPGARMYRTGDLGRYRPDGSIEFLGRIDHQVKIRGYRIELGEIEAALTRHHTVSACVVVAYEYTPTDRRLAAYVVAHKGKTVTTHLLRDYVASQLPEYMVPATFILIDALPLTPNGKIDRRRLPSLTTARPELAADFVAPRTHWEEQLAQTWSAVLGLDRVGIHDHFLALGGDSMLSLQIVGHATLAGIPLTPRHIFEYPTIAELAQFVESLVALHSQSSGDMPVGIKDDRFPLPVNVKQSSQYHGLQVEQALKVIPFEVEDVYPLAKMQEVLLIHSMRRPAHEGVYHCQYSFHLRDTTFSLAALEKAVRVTVQRTPILRTVFVMSGDTRFQAVCRDISIPLTVTDLRHLDALSQNRWIDRWIDEDRQRPFAIDNASEPLFRLCVCLRSAESFEFCMSIHHAIIDGWSYLTLLQQLVVHYLAAKKDEMLPMPIQQNVYKEFVTLEQEIVHSELAPTFWKDHLLLHQGYTLVPLAEPEPLSSPYEKVLRHEVSAALRRLQHQLSVSPKAVFLSGFLELIRLLTGQDVVTVGVVANARSSRLSDPIGAIGLFWNIVPFYYPMAGRWDGRIRQVQDRLQAIDPHVAFPLTEIETCHGTGPLFFATFNFVHFHHAKQLNHGQELQLLDLRGYDKLHFPLNFTAIVSPYDDNLKFQFSYDPTYFSAQTVRALASDFGDILEQALIP